MESPSKIPYQGCGSVFIGGVFRVPPSPAAYRIQRVMEFLRQLFVRHGRNFLLRKKNLNGIGVIGRPEYIIDCKKNGINHGREGWAGRSIFWFDNGKNLC